jgi:protein phosphatase
VKLGRAAVVTDTGRRRLGNEDAYVWKPPLFAIADGMGGAQAGEVAAGLAADALESVDADTLSAAGIEALIADANRRIWERSLSDPATSGMGTTVTVALVHEEAGEIVVGHVGDSRAYRLRDGVLEQITTDHSLVAELVESGMLTPEEAERHPQRSAITRALGTEPAVDADVFAVDAAPGDLFLLCSDGLSDMLTVEQIASTIERADRDPSAAGEALVAAANARGGEDNITVVVFEILAADAEPAAEAEETAAPAASPSAATDGTDGHLGALASEPEPALPPAEKTGLRRHGAGPGGRIAATLLIVLALALAAYLLYRGVGS